MLLGKPCSKIYSKVLDLFWQTLILCVLSCIQNVFNILPNWVGGKYEGKHVWQPTSAPATDGKFGRKRKSHWSCCVSYPHWRRRWQERWWLTGPRPLWWPGSSGVETSSSARSGRGSGTERGKRGVSDTQYMELIWTHMLQDRQSCLFFIAYQNILLKRILGLYNVVHESYKAPFHLSLMITSNSIARWYRPTLNRFVATDNPTLRGSGLARFA